MASIGNLEVDVEVKSNPEKFWNGIRDSDKIFPTAFPELYKSIEILEGDGKAVGSVRLVKFAEGTLNLSYYTYNVVVYFLLRTLFATKLVDIRHF